MMGTLTDAHRDWLTVLAKLVGATETASENVPPSAQQTSRIAAAPTQNSDVETDPPFGPQENWVMQGVLLEPNEASIRLGEDLQFGATGIYSEDHEQDETDALEWSSSDPDVARVDQAKKGHFLAGEKTGQVTISAREPNTGRTGHAKLTVAPLTSQMSDDDMAKGEAYQEGYTDGMHGDPRRREFATNENPDVPAAYDEGYKDGNAGLDQKWDRLGKRIDAINVAKRPTKPDSNSPSQLFDELGIVGSIISILEANGARALSRGVVGTTIGAILLPIFAFKLGADIAQKREDHKQAIHDFVEKFVAITSFDALERARGMVKADEAKLTEFNDSGRAQATATYNRFHAEMKSLLEDYIDDEKPESAFVAMHDEWVVTMSKQWATFMTNPRFHD